MPWCESCDNWTPTSANADGTCPVCDSALTGTPGVDHEPAVPGILGSAWSLQAAISCGEF